MNFPIHNDRNIPAVHGALANTGDEFFHNATELLLELRGHDITPTAIQAAIGRIGAPSSRFDTRRRRPLHFVQASMRQLSPAAQQDDPNRKPGQFIQGANKTPADYAREREAALAKNRPTQPEPVRVIEARAKAEAESLRGNSHSQDAQLGRIFVNKPGGGIDWPGTLAARKAMQARFSNRSIL
jgi:hypothetical protein